MHWLISKFILIAKRTRFTLKQLGKILIRNEMTDEEKEVFIKMLYNKKALLA